MPISVSLPNGATIQFPDTMSGDEIAGVMRKHFGAPAAAPPSFDSEDYVHSLAEKHGASPAYVRSLRDSQSNAEGVRGIPLAGGVANKVGGAISAFAQPVMGTGAAGASFGERAAKNKALEDELAADYARAHPTEATAANLIGGAVATAPLGATAAGARALGMTGGMASRIGLGAASYSGLSAADAAVRGEDPARAALVGGLAGAAGPVAAKAIGAVLAPVVSNITARINPQRFASGQVARAISESGRTADQIANDVTTAAREGQNQFTVGDALGNPGQRMLSTIARAPGEGRTDVVNFLEQRQAGQGRRVANTLAEGFDAPETAAATEARLRAERATEADQNYGAVRQSVGAINVTPVVQRIDQTLQPGVTRLVNPQSGIADDSIEAMLRRARNLLTDGRSQVSRFDEAFRVKQEFDNMIDRAPPTAQRVMIPVRDALDDQLAASSPFYRAARDRYREQSRAIEALGLGRQAAMRGRVENTIPAFQRLPSAQQGAYRAGYADPLIEQVQGGAVGVNKARPLTSDAFQAEGQAMAPGNNLMQRRIGRENTMFETRATATGGSKTADNLADAHAMGTAIDFAHQIGTGNIGGLARNALGMMSRLLTGNTPAVRQEAARLLLMRGGNVTAQDLRDVLNSAVQQVHARERFARLATALAAHAAAQRASQPRGQ